MHVNTNAHNMLTISPCNTGTTAVITNVCLIVYPCCETGALSACIGKEFRFLYNNSTILILIAACANHNLCK